MLREILISGVIISQSFLSLNHGEFKVDGKPLTQYIEEIPYHDEYEYNTYKITKVNGNAIFGKATNNISFDNAGIFLYQDELNIKLKKGDNILVTFNEINEILDIKKMD